MESFPEQGTQVGIYHNGSFESLSSVLANANLNDLTAVFYWFTPDCDEPKNSIWYHDKKLIGTDVSRDKPYPWRGSMYCQIGDQIWFGQDRLMGADVASFFITGWDRARDKHGAWYQDSRREDDDGNDE